MGTASARMFSKGGSQRQGVFQGWQAEPGLFPRGAAVEKRIVLPLPGLELRSLSRPARRQSLYRLRYPGSYFIAIELKYFPFSLVPDILHSYVLISHADSLYTQLWQVVALYCDLKHACIALDGNSAGRIDRNYGRPPYVFHLFTWGDTAFNIHDTII
jgi:hypothetical protein